MRILFSLYRIDASTGLSSLELTKWTDTDLSLGELEQHFGLREGYILHVFSGQSIEFWDLFFVSNDLREIISKIESIPNCCSTPPEIKLPFLMRVREYNPEVDKKKKAPERDNVFLYNYFKYEIGSSGFSAITYWMAGHPLEMIFFAGIIWDSFKWFIKKVFRIKRDGPTLQPVVLRVRRFYGEFSMCTKIQETDFQIVKIIHVNPREFIITVRTISNKEFEVHCLPSGAITSLEDKGIPLTSSNIF